MRVGVVGINHKLADLRLREALAKICQRHFGSLQFVQDHHFILLSTCNRTEVYFTSNDLAATHTYLLSILRQDIEEEFDHKLYSYFGVDCFFHLTCVAAGLDSAIIAETEIQGQVKNAYETASHSALLPKELHYLFQNALGISKKIRTEFQLGHGMPNLEHAILQTGRHFFNHSTNPRILFVGASEINQKILAFLQMKDYSHITVCNRSDDPSSSLAKRYAVHQLAWGKLFTWHQYDWIIFGTKSPDYLIREADFCSQAKGHKLVMDLCVPRNVEPKLAQDPRITLMNIDQINRLLKIRHRGIIHAVGNAERRINEETHRQADRYRQKEQSKIVLLAASA